MSPRYAPAIPLPPYAYVPGHDLPHPVTDPRGHSYRAHAASHHVAIPPAALAQLPTDPASRRRLLAATLTATPQWRSALDLFNEGFYWEAHEAWEGFWNALARTTPEARFVQGLIHLAAAAVKAREGKPAGVTRHTQRARELLGETRRAGLPGELLERLVGSATTLGLAPDSLAAVVTELEELEPECWHASRARVVRVVTSALRLAE
jgi:hypothetical protein